MMQNLNLTMPTHVTEALRTNMTAARQWPKCFPKPRQPYRSCRSANSRLASSPDGD